MSYVDVFGGSVIKPSEVSYLKINMTGDVQLSWSTDFQNVNEVLADIMELDPNGSGYTLFMPNATNASVGETVLLRNISANPVNINRFGIAGPPGNIVTIPGGGVYYVYLRNNTTTEGDWVAIPFGSSGAVGVSQISITSANVDTTSNLSFAPIGVQTNVVAYTYELLGDLLAISKYPVATSGLTVRVPGAPLSWAARSIIGTPNQVIVADGDGVAGNPTLSLGATLEIENGIVFRTNNVVSIVAKDGIYIDTPPNKTFVLQKRGALLLNNTNDDGHAGFYADVPAGVRYALKLPDNVPITDDNVFMFNRTPDRISFGNLLGNVALNNQVKAAADVNNPLTPSQVRLSPASVQYRCNIRPDPLNPVAFQILGVPYHLVAGNIQKTGIGQYTITLPDAYTNTDSYVVHVTADPTNVAFNYRCYVQRSSPTQFNIFTILDAGFNDGFNSISISISGQLA